MLNTVSISAAWTNLQQTARNCDLPMPSKLAAQISEINATYSESRFPDGDVAAYRQGIVDAARAGTDPLNNEAVRNHLLRAMLAERAGAVLQDARQAALADAFAQGFDAIVKTWRPHLQKAGQSISVAQALLPDHLDLADNINVNVVDHRQLTSWSLGRSSLAVLESVAATWRTAFVAITGQTVYDRHLPLVFSALTGDQLSQLPNRKPAAAARAGHTIHLATVREYLHRTQATEASEVAA